MVYAIILGAVAVVAVVWTIREMATDGHRRVETRPELINF